MPPRNSLAAFSPGYRDWAVVANIYENAQTPNLKGGTAWILGTKYYSEGSQFEGATGSRADHLGCREQPAPLRHKSASPPRPRFCHNCPPMDTNNWRDLGPITTFLRAPVTEVVIDRGKLAISQIDGKIGVVSGVCNHAGGPLGHPLDHPRRAHRPR